MSAIEFERCRKCGLPVYEPTTRYTEPVVWLADGSKMHVWCFIGNTLEGVGVTIGGTVDSVVSVDKGPAGPGRADGGPDGSP